MKWRCPIIERMERLGTRKIDELGRVVLPSELRAKFGWGEKDSLAMYYVDDNTLMIQLAEKYQRQRCVFCGTIEANFFSGNKAQAYSALKQSGIWAMYTEHCETTHTLSMLITP